MTTTTATDSAGLSVYNPYANVGTGKSEMGQADFLRLLTAQMQTQDPFEPVDNAQMVAQMATITNSSGIAEMNQTLKNLASQLTGSRLGDAASWIGKSMLVQSNIAAPDAAGQYMGQVSFADATSGASVDLIDGNGNVVKTIELGDQPKGDINFYWDGKDEAGNTIATDALKIKVNGASPSRVASWATIAAVQSPADGSSSKLITALGTYSPSDAISLA
ncbi:MULTISPECIES: flagellar hook assembly protein FlgD [Sphingobium]|uniref:Basal-body rod modification protein FlgD n=2 Tax=Sphingobium fuliginis (strain ATCC 27551) TaxID=336203 RepID=A0ABQ1ELJ9_SPHSA|nr:MULTISPECIES: flagellar hook capping FlgD N-terminal domain-containing protein [Sphingobium]AJR22823.1 flagellar hook capping protein [Sphingobium sp. YBL2]QDC38132.1 flagellar hook capping protein [Sphingobium fuliginis ATCC 27551]RYM01186.1 flagellar hook capping protein [Sphingobium fuliginis]WDA38757.1 flagellar hook capping FlgD N-terminal domain-containing protein [Sphingobium sp. YC-XJ3]GFZ77366.1 basal-body rod modification protein FlgD [Sphingobium fuliginis]